MIRLKMAIHEMYCIAFCLKKVFYESFLNEEYPVHMIRIQKFMTYAIKSFFRILCKYIHIKLT